MREFVIDDIRLAILGTMLAQVAEKYYILDESKFVLEAGCGSGKFGIHYALRFGCNVTLLDIDPQMVDVAHRLVRSVEEVVGVRLPVSMREGDIMKLPFKDATFDLVFNEGVVEHWSDDRRLKCIQEMARVSRDCVIIITNDAEGERSRKRAEETVHTYVSMPEKETPYTASELTENMQKAGLVKVKVGKVSDPQTQEFLVGVGFKSA